MKRILMMLMVAGLIIFPSPVSAAEAGGQVEPTVPGRPAQVGTLIDEQKAREALNSLLPWIPEDVKLTASLQDTSGDGIMAWVFENFRTAGSGPSSFRASIDARNGSLFSFYYRPPRYQYKAREIAFSRDQALRIALDYLKKMQGSTTDLELESGTALSKAVVYSFSTDYVFTWSRKVNGLVVNSDGVTIGVDAYTGRVNQYWSNWHEGSFPSIEGILSVEDMEKDVIGRLGLYLGYASEQEKYGYNYGTGKLLPVYRINNQWSMVDAHSGELLDLKGKAISDDKARLFDKAMLLKSKGQPVPADNNISQPPSPESIQQTAQKYMNLLGYTGEVRRTGGGYGGFPGRGQEYWSYAPVRDSSSLRVNIDTHTGEFVGFSREGARSALGMLPVIDSQQAEQKAREAIERFNPELKDQLLLSASFDLDDSTGWYQVSFARLINGLPYSGQGLYMSIDRSNGDVVNYHLSWAPVDLAPQMSLINEEKARQSLEDAQILIPCYFYPYTNSGTPAATSQLVYRFKEILGVDAVSGELLYSPYYQGDKGKGYSHAIDDKLSPSLQLLHQNGLMIPADCNSNSPVSRRSVIQALVSASRFENTYTSGIEPDSDSAATPEEQNDINLVNSAVSLGIIGKNQDIDLNQTASRREAAVWAVKLLGYQDIAEMPARVEISVQDADQIPAPYWNYLGIAFGLGLLKEREPAHLCPEQDLSWSDLGDLIARFVPLTEARTAGTGNEWPIRIYGSSSIPMR